MDTKMRAADGLYSLTLAFLFSHEVDAAYRHEWRVLPLTSFLPDDLGRDLFVWIHVPLFAAILIYGSRRPVWVWLAAFAMGHVLLHWMFRNHPAYEFNNPSPLAPDPRGRAVRRPVPGGGPALAKARLSPSRCE